LKTDEDVTNSSQLITEILITPHLKVNDKWGKLMKKDDKSREDLDKLYWYNDNQKDEELRYQFLLVKSLF
jgi:hypothetical protein